MLSPRSFSDLPSPKAGTTSSAPPSSRGGGGAPVSQIYQLRCWPATRAAYFGNIEIARFLLGSGASVMDGKSHTPTEAACSRSNTPHRCTMLLAKGTFRLLASGGAYLKFFFRPKTPHR